MHDNIFVGGQYAALAFRATESALKVAYAYNNTVYSTLKGTYFSVLPSVDYAVVGNLIFAAAPISGFISNFANNITDTVANAVTYVNAPSFLLGSMDFYPRSTKVESASLDLTKFASNHDYKLDFNGIPKDFAINALVFRFMWEQAETVIRWADWAQRMVEDWPDTAPQPGAEAVGALRDAVQSSR